MNKSYPNLTMLAKNLLPSLLEDDEGTGKSNAYHRFNMLFRAKTCEYNVNLGKETGFSKSRWTRLVNQYVDQDRLEAFINVTRKLGNQCSASMLFKSIAGKRLNHQYGNCLLSVTYCNNTLTLLSRTCYAGYMSFFDLALAYKIAEKIGDPSKIKFRWYVVDLQVSYLRSMQVIFLNKRLMTKLKSLHKKTKTAFERAPLPWQRVAGVYRRRFLYHYAKSGMKMLDEAKYGPAKRYIEKWFYYRGKLKPKGVYPKSFTLKDIEL